MPSFDLGGGGMQQAKYEAASPSKFEPKYEPNLSMENSSSSQVGETRPERLGEAPARNILVAPTENNSISMTLMQWESTTYMQTIIHANPPLTSETL